MNQLSKSGKKSFSIKWRNMLILGTSTLALYVGAAGWEALGPGCGGQIQGFYLDPVVPERAFFMMDVEGAYRTDTGGESWNAVPQNNVMFYSYEALTSPADPNRTYIGTFWGLQHSDDGGERWELSPDPKLRNTMFGALAIDMNAPDRVYAAPNWRTQDNLPFNVLNIEKQYKIGEREIFYSLDGGNNWATSQYETNGWKAVYSITPDPADTNVLWIGAHSGLYRGVLTGSDYNWTRIPGPDLSENEDLGGDSDKAYCYGADLSPDGQYVYVSFGIDKDDAPDIWSNGVVQVTKETRMLSLPYVASVSNLLDGVVDADWTCLARTANKGMLYVPDADTIYGEAYYQTWPYRINTGINYWKPKVDPRSTATRHKVLIGELDVQGHQRCGLFEGDFTVPTPGSSTDISGEWTRVFAQKGTENPGAQTFDFETGWQSLTSRARHYGYTPSTWTNREIWVADDQNLYKADLDFSDAYVSGSDEPYLHNWEPVCAKAVTNIGSKTTYINRGIVSTVDYDVAAWSNYVVAVGADNSLYESYDNGASWLNAQIGTLGQGDACIIVPTTPRLAIVGYASNVFGGGAPNTGTDLYAKDISDLNNNNPWIRIASGNLGGLQRGATDLSKPDATERVYKMSYDPNHPDRIYLAGAHGIHLFDNVVDAYTEMKAQYDAGTAQKNFSTTHTYVHKIYDAGIPNPITYVAYNEVFADADTPDTFYFKTRSDIIKGTRLGDGSYTNEAIYSSTTGAENINSFGYWNDGTNDWFTVGTIKSGSSVKLRKNDGPWYEIMNREKAKAVAEEDEWLVSLDNHFGNTTEVQLAVNGVTGHGDEVFCALYSREFRRGVGILRGKIAADGGVLWEDWSGTFDYGDHDFLYLSWIRTPRIVEQGTNTYFYACTQGAGTWRKEILNDFVASTNNGTGGSGPGIPGIPFNVEASSASPTSIFLQWREEADAEEYEIEQSINGGAFQPALTVYAPDISHTFTDLATDTPYAYRVLARNTIGSSDWSASASATTGTAAPGVELVNGDFETGNRTPWNTGDIITGTNVYAGTYSMEKSRPTKGYSNINQDLDNVGGGTDYILSAFIKTDLSEGDAGFKVYIYDAGGGQLTTFTSPATTSATYTNISLAFTTPLGTSSMRVQLRLQNGIGTVWFDDVELASPVAIPTPSISAIPLSASSIQISWSEVAEATEYDLQQMKAGESFLLSGTFPAPTNGIAVAGLDPETKYTYRILARNGDGESPLSVPAWAVTQRTSIPTNEVQALFQIASTNENLTIEKSTNLVDWVVITPPEAEAVQLHGSDVSAEAELRLDQTTLESYDAVFYRLLVLP